MSDQQSEQLTLQLDVREKCKVCWFVAEQTVKKRRLWFGNKVVTKMLSENNLAKTHKIDSDDIPKVNDPELRSYLQLQDIANAMGWIPEGSGASYGHHVHVEATDDGFESKFISGYVLGNDESLFVADMHRFAPTHEDN